MSTAVYLALLVVLLCILLYAILGGADYGGGVWDLCASGKRAQNQRWAIGVAMGPVWETNHMWLIFAIVTLFTCFPPIFAKLSVALFVPLTLALVGIVMRGAAFAFRGPSTRDMTIHKVWGVIFGVASLLTPFLFGAAAAGVATGTFDWLAPLSLCIGLFAVALCAQIAAVFLGAETQGDLQSDFRLRALIATVAVAAVGLLALSVARAVNPALFGGLLGAWPAVAIAMGAGLGVVALVWTRHFRTARALCGLQTTAILAGWYLAEAPMLNTNLGLHAVAASEITVVTYLWIALAGSLVLLPSLWLLFSVFKRETIDA
ncbi:MAG: cytochrome d ubiquinol oxidase subunit II [Candidatus Eremiobacteraeota bacterium]|nr:cytochrome d ubiquinol oxidase subunit II [Candidatus Eremiobacteraeota bacterium]